MGDNVRERADAALALLGYSVVPDLSASSLSINNKESGDPNVKFIQFAGGFTPSQDFPLYLEGGVGYGRYDPTFIATRGAEERPVPLKWNSFAGTVGVGWDFPIARELKFRPIANFAFGHVESDTSFIGLLVEAETGLPVDDFFKNGRLSAYGYGGSLMLDWEHYRADYEIDAELRYTYIRLESFGDTSDSVKGRADVPTASLWTRWRAPTGISAFDRPLRYVLEYAYSSYLGDQAGVLGFNHLNTIGIGFEIDSSAYDMYISRVRVVGRYRFGNNVSGFGFGLAASF